MAMFYPTRIESEVNKMEFKHWLWHLTALHSYEQAVEKRIDEMFTQMSSV